MPGPRSQREPQLEPSDHCWTVLQDHGPTNGGWGPAYITMPGTGLPPTVVAYTGDDPLVINVLKNACRTLTQKTGKSTKLVRYSQREDVFSVGGSS